MEPSSRAMSAAVESYGRAVAHSCPVAGCGAALRGVRGGATLVVRDERARFRWWSLDCLPPRDSMWQARRLLPPGFCLAARQHGSGCGADYAVERELVLGFGGEVRCSEPSVTLQCPR